MKQRHSYPERCIHELFADQVKRTPDATALVFGRQRFSYRELDQRATGLANALKQYRIQPETLVGICMNRSAEAIISILGVLKAGGVVMPMDTTYPRERLQYMLQDARCALILATRKSRARLPHGTEFLCVEDAACVTKQKSFPACAALTPDNALSVLYTSGSTGEPKGVVRTHRGISNRLSWVSFQPDDIYAHVLSLNVGYAEPWLYLPLVSGIPIVLVSDWTVKDSTKLATLIEAHRITGITLTPSILRSLLSSGGDARSRLRSLRTVNVGSSPLSQDLIESSATLLPDAVLLNDYGGTEVGAVIRGRMSRATVTGVVGRELPNTHSYIFDARLRVVTPGEAGELYIAADSLARGYLHKPGLTAQRFIANPFTEARGTLLYRTGDFVRRTPDGDIQLLGREDRQVKIRGFRVELSEIEATLKQHDSVREAVVTVEERLKETRLIAYIMGGVTVEHDANYWSQYLRSRLPTYMVPALFVYLKQIPLTINGKIDWKALPPPDTIRQGMNGAHVAPRDSEEAAIARAFAELLGLDHVGSCDNLIDLGGDSLMASRVLSQIREEFGLELPIRLLFDSTVAELAATIRSHHTLEQEEPAAGQG
jgi:amino acid adenylation domain-containing protein